MTRVIAALVLLLACAMPARADQPLAAVLHLHSDLSTGEFSLEALAEMAERNEIGALLVTENHLLRLEYGLPPFRALTRVAHERPSVLSGGASRYAERIAAVRQRFPRLLIIPGIEVIPHYHWTGSLAAGLTLTNVQKNLLVFGVTDPRRLASLPVIGTRAGGLGLSSLLDLVPVLLLIPGAWLLRVKRTRRVRIGRAFVIVRTRRWGPGIVLCAIGVVALVRGWPFTVDPHPYWRDAGLVPHQQLIEHVRQLGGVTVWSFPEARDFGEREVGPLRVTWRTDPYSDDLLRTHGYTAFGALYEDTTTFERPGFGWDRLLGQYVAGERREPVWAVAESGFHGPTAGKRLTGVQTVLMVRERSEAAVLDALRRGRMYARIGLPAPSIALAEFSVRAGDGTAGIAEKVSAPAGTPIEVHVGVDGVRGAEQPVRVMLIRDGSVVMLWTGTTPFRAVHRDTAGGQPGYFRLDVSAGAHRLLANPIFVRPGTPR